MSQVPACLQIQEDDVKAFIACSAHIGMENLDATMSRYVYKRNSEGIHILDVRKTWEKIVLAARVIVAMENPKEICVVALSPAGTPSPAQRAILKFANYVGCRTISGRMSPGTFTNHRQIHFLEPRLLITSDARIDHQPIVEASYANIPIISFVNTHHSLRGIDVAIPINTSSRQAIALGYWMLAREVLRLRATIRRDQHWPVMIDMFIYKDPEDGSKAAIGGDGDKQADGGWDEVPVNEDYTAPTEEYETGTWGAEDGGDADWVGGEGGDSWGNTTGNW